MRVVKIVILFSSISYAGFCQEALSHVIGFEDEDLSKAITTIEDTYDVLFSFKDDIIVNKTITIKKANRTIEALLLDLQIQTELNFVVLQQRYIVVTADSTLKSTINNLDIIVLKSYLTSGIKKNKKGEFILTPKKLGILPGLIEPDVLETIQQLPSVVSPNETATGFFVRGGFSDQNRLIWDGINLYHKGHLFGMISPVNPNVVSEIKFSNKGTHPRYGERLSSVIEMTSAKNISNTIKAQIGFNGLNADALLQFPIVKDKLDIQTSLRTSYANIFETPTFTQLEKKVFESTKISRNNNGNNQLFYNDFNIKLNYKPNDKHSLYASFIHIDNHLDYSLNNSENNTMLNDLLSIKNNGYGLGWKQKWNSNWQHNFEAFFSEYALNYNFVTSTDDNFISNFEKQNTIFDSGVSLEFNYNPSQTLQYDFGYQYTLKDVAFAFINTADLRFVLDTEEAIIQSHSAYWNLSYSSKNFFDVALGLRSTYFKELDALRLEPRLKLSKAITNHVHLHLTGEVKHQIINEVNETIFSDLSLENNVWMLANSNIPIKRSIQATLGVMYNASDFSIDVDTYYKNINDITALSLGFLNPDGSGFDIGTQTIYGVETFIKKRFGNLNFWTSYGFNSATNRFKTINSNASFKSKANVRHAISTAINFTRNQWQFSLGWRWQTGRPFTISEQIDGELQFNKGVNTGTLPNYHRLDVSTTYAFMLSKSNNTKCKVGLSLRNLYNRRSLISKEYRGNNNFSEPIEVIERFSLGITPNAMFRVYF